MPSCEAADHCNSQDEPSKAAPVPVLFRALRHGPFIYSSSSQGHRPWGQEVQHHCDFESSRNSGCSMRRALCSDQRTKYSVYSVHEIKTGFAWWPGSISLNPSTQPSAPSTTLATCPGFQVLPRCAKPGTGRCKMWWQGCPACWVAQKRALPPQGGHRGWGRLVLPHQLWAEESAGSWEECRKLWGMGFARRQSHQFSVSYTSVSMRSLLLPYWSQKSYSFKWPTRS